MHVPQMPPAGPHICCGPLLLLLQVRTYDVVPISPSLGMVAFVPGTRPLKALLTDPALVAPEAVAAADNRYSTFILTKGGNLERAGDFQALHCLHTRSI